MTRCRRCSTEKVTTYNAVRIPRERCPVCDGVARHVVPSFDDRAVVSQRHLEVKQPPTGRWNRPALAPIQPDVSGYVDHPAPKPLFINPAIVRVKTVRPVREPGAPKQYQPKPCERPFACGQPFIPTGARSKWCETCQPRARRAMLADYEARRTPSRREKPATPAEVPA